MYTFCHNQRNFRVDISETYDKDEAPCEKGCTVEIKIVESPDGKPFQLKISRKLHFTIE